jgi:hypothetical protein
MSNLAWRLEKAFLHSIAAFLIAGLSSCVLLTIAVSGSHDGQAGMEAAFGGFYIAILAAISTFIVSMVRNSPNRRPIKRDK